MLVSYGERQCGGEWVRNDGMDISGCCSWVRRTCASGCAWSGPPVCEEAHSVAPWDYGGGRRDG